MKEYCVKTEWTGYEITAKCSVLDVGIHVLVIGGCSTHVGAVSWAFPGEEVQTVEFPTHREKTVSERWAKELCLRSGGPVVVACGIHYDGVNREQIQEIVDVTEDLLGELEGLLF